MNVLQLDLYLFSMILLLATVRSDINDFIINSENDLSGWIGDSDEGDHEDDFSYGYGDGECGGELGADDYESHIDYLAYLEHMAKDIPQALEMLNQMSENIIHEPPQLFIKQLQHLFAQLQTEGGYIASERILPSTSTCNAGESISKFYNAIQI